MGGVQKSPTQLNRRDLLKYGLYGGLTATLAPGLWLSGCGKKSAHRGKPNIVVILIDTLRPEYLSFYGYKKKNAAFLAEIAKQSTIFTRGFATSSWTAPSTASLFTSQYPLQHGVIEGFFCHRIRMAKLQKMGKAQIPINRIPKDIPTLPQIFKSMGYRTFGVAANINIGDEIGFSRGFDEFQRISKAPAEEIYNWTKKREKQIQGAKPFFLYLHPNDVHSPYHERQPYYKKQKNAKEDARARYLSEIGYVDEYIGAIYEMLRVDDNTIFVVLSDHGEEFWDHGSDGHRPKLYRELTQVLMMFHAPALGIEPQRIDVNVGLIDVLSTLVDIASGDEVQGAQGLSLKGLLTKGAESKNLGEKLRNRMLFAHRIVHNPQIQIWAAIYQHWNLIEKLYSNKELFDHRKDFSEKNNVISKYPKLASQLMAELKKFKHMRQREGVEKVSVDLDENLLKDLKSLGYVE
jgi:choline-sulfatase